MEQRLIDANELRIVPDYGGTMARGNGKTIHEVLFAVQQFIDNAPTVDAVPVVHGRWILVSKGNFSPGGFEIEEKCSECGRYVYRYEGQPQDNYCPNCGAKMRGETDEE